ncbi:MAG TPA: phosphate signaling complex protein PhoU [Firmicutes bacterium]|nr:phosphate signaling complex protein PhoU [Candidatus Fermentithermobacillaceae bacterium]
MNPEATARKSFHQELEKLEDDVVKLATMAEEAVARAVKSLKQKDVNMAQKIIDGDDVLDDLALDIENRCFSMLALQQPMASDLRTIGSALKIVTDLERIGDHAVDIAKVTRRLYDKTYIKPLIDIPRMAQITQEMLRSSLQAFVKKEVNFLDELKEQDDEVDHLYSQIFRELLTFMMADPSTINQAMEFLMVASHLERVADHATNIGEWVYYAVTGERKDLNI